MNRKSPPLLIASLFFSLVGQSQTDSLLLTIQDTTVKASLLPSKMIFTQCFLWGEQGLMRTTKLMPLNEEDRKLELKIRRSMLVAHQIGGYITLAGMIAQGIVGAKLYNYQIVGSTRHDLGYRNLKNLHGELAVAVDLTYFTTAALSLFAPPPLIYHKNKKITSIMLHKNLAIIHLSAMIAANILSIYTDKYPSVSAYHRGAAYTAFAAFGLAMVVMKF